jgi:TonB family protein
MSDRAEIKPAADGSPAGQFPGIRWNWKKLVYFTVLVFAAQCAFLFLTGNKKFPRPRSVENVPQFQLADKANELIALEDPTLFVLPHIEDFVPAVWRQLPFIPPPSIRWTEPPPYLPPATEGFGAEFAAFMASNRFEQLPLNFKPVPVITSPEVRVESLLPPSSNARFTGGLAGRQLRKPVSVPTLAVNDVLAPSRVQLLVDGDGNVISTVLLDSSGSDPADQKALAIAQQTQFVPAGGLTFGEMIFNWQTVPQPVTTTNAP